MVAARGGVFAQQKLLQCQFFTVATKEVWLDAIRLEEAVVRLQRAQDALGHAARVLVLWRDAAASSGSFILLVGRVTAAAVVVRSLENTLAQPAVHLVLVQVGADGRGFVAPAGIVVRLVGQQHDILGAASTWGGEQRAGRRSRRSAPSTSTDCGAAAAQQSLLGAGGCGREGVRTRTLCS